MRICLVRTPAPFLIDDMAFPPLGLMAVATSLKMNGHEVTIHDGALENIPAGYEGYGFGPTIPEYPAALQGKAIVKGRDSGARVILGGPYVSIADEAINQDGWDCIIRGDGEVAAHVAFTGKAAYVQYPNINLDSYPIIDRSTINLDKYLYYVNGVRSTSLVTSRGCPWKCSFCCKTELNNSVRLRSAENVIKEIDYLHCMGFRAMHIPDDIAIIDFGRMLKIADHFGHLGVIWRCLVRADLIVKYGPQFAKIMAQNGLVDVGMGIESGSDKVLKAINKGESADTIRKAVGILNNAGITVKGYFILGLPGESHETLRETERFLEEMHLADVDIKVYQPYPGSEIYRNKAAFDIDWDNIPLQDQFYKGRIGDYHGTVRTSGLDNAEIAQAMNYLEGKYKRAS